MGLYLCIFDESNDDKVAGWQLGYCSGADAWADRLFARDQERRGRRRRCRRRGCAVAQEPRASSGLFEIVDEFYDAAVSGADPSIPELGMIDTVAVMFFDYLR